MAGELTVINWRDIPMQLVARGPDGTAARALLSERFQESVDAAAMVAGLIGSDDYIVLVGGAPLNEEFGQAIGADAYCRDAAVAAETAQALVLARRAAAKA